jgi:DNA-directed RNA polymerase specialized sigma24 family protein
MGAAAVLESRDRGGPVRSVRRVDAGGGKTVLPLHQVDIDGFEDAELAARLLPPSPPDALSIERLELRELIGAALDALAPRDRVILTSRFGLDGGEPMPREDLAALLGTNRHAVRRWERGALRAFRRLAENLPGSPKARGSQPQGSTPATLAGQSHVQTPGGRP